MSGIDQGRRRFLVRTATAAAVLAVVPTALVGCGDDEETTEVQRNEAWEALAADYEGREEIYTNENAEGREWGDKLAVHMPEVAFSGSTATVTVSHPMVAEHWINAIYVRNQDGIVIALVDNGADALNADAVDTVPSLSVDLPAGTTSITAYAYCNLHDHWMQDAVAVS